MRGDRIVTILHVFPSFARGGQQMRLAAVARAGGAAFFHHIASLDGDLSARSAFADAGAAFHPLVARKSPGVSLRNLRGLKALMLDLKADILCTYNFGALEAVIANRLGPRLPHIHYEDGFGPDETASRQKRRRIFMRRWALQHSLVAVPSKGLADLALKRWKVPAARLRRIPNGVDVEKFACAARRPAEDGVVVIGSVGALRPEKNYERLMRVFKVVAAKTGVKTGAKLVIYGDGPERDRLAAVAGALNGAAVLKGPTDAPDSVYGGFDVFALSSDTEQAPLSLLEAMAAGLPVVATDVGDIQEMLSAENADFVTPAGEEAAFAAALGRLVEDADLRRRLGAANAEKARAVFGLEAMTAAHITLFCDAYDKGAS